MSITELPKDSLTMDIVEVMARALWGAVTSVDPEFQDQVWNRKYPSDSVINQEVIDMFLPDEDIDEETEDGRPYFVKGKASYFENARAALSALADAGCVVERGWQPMETAPRDGTPFLAFGGGLDHVDLCRYDERVGCWDCCGATLDDIEQEPDGYSRPTHWRPIPMLSAAQPASKED